MTRLDIVKSLMELYPKLHKDVLDQLVKDMFSYLSVQLSQGNRIEIRGFGCYSVKTRAPGLIRNAKKGISIPTGERNVVYFRAGKKLKERVNS